MNGLKLNLGCGEKRIPGYINVDKYGSPDIKHDLESFPWPWETNSVSDIVLIHVLEHIGKDVEIYFGIFKEMYRICTHGAKIKIIVPHFRHQFFYDDPTHCSPFTNVSLKQFLGNHGFAKINVAPFLVDKSEFFWKFKYNFKLASLLPFTNHESKNNIFIPKFLRGKSTSMICTSLISK